MQPASPIAAPRLRRSRPGVSASANRRSIAFVSLRLSVTFGGVRMDGSEQTVLSNAPLQMPNPNQSRRVLVSGCEEGWR